MLHKANIFMLLWAEWRLMKQLFGRWMYSFFAILICEENTVFCYMLLRPLSLYYFGIISRREYIWVIWLFNRFCYFHWPLYGSFCPRHYNFKNKSFYLIWFSWRPNVAHTHTILKPTCKYIYMQLHLHKWIRR